MRLAFLNPFPNTICAETEFLHRAMLACKALKWEAMIASTSNEIIEFDPDCVLTLTEGSPKRTGIITLGIMWSPPSLVHKAAHCIRNTLSYDGCIPASAAVRQYIRELLHSTRKDTPMADFAILPSCHRTPFAPRASDEYFLFYVGRHWDGRRHSDVLNHLLHRVPMHIYGPKEAWTHLSSGYMGSVAFDGCTLLDKIAKAGVALCIHTADHRAANVPSCRLFEAAAAGAVIIADKLDYTRNHFGDSILYVDMDQPAQAAGEEIVSHMNWIQANPHEARALAQRSHQIFSEKLCLEKQFEPLPAFVSDVRRTGGWTCDDSILPEVLQAQPPRVEYIVNVACSSNVLERCLQSLSAQSYPNVGVILSARGSSLCLEEVTRKYEAMFASFRIIRGPERCARSTLLWQAMRVATAPFFATCDENDFLQPNHVATLMAKLSAATDAGLAFSGTVHVNEEPDNYVWYLCFDGPLGETIKENRDLRFFEPFHPFQLIERSAPIHENSWIARRNLLDGWILDDDPNIDSLEHILLLLLLQEKTRFVFSWRPTAEHHLHSTSSARSSLSEDTVTSCEQIIARRTRYLPLLDDYRRRHGHPVLDMGAIGVTPLANARRGQLVLAALAIPRLLGEYPRLGTRMKKGVKILRQRGMKEFMRKVINLGRGPID